MLRKLATWVGRIHFIERKSRIKIVKKSMRKLMDVYVVTFSKSHGMSRFHNVLVTLWTDDVITIFCYVHTNAIKFKSRFNNVVLISCKEVIYWNLKLQCHFEIIFGHPLYLHQLSVWMNRLSLPCKNFVVFLFVISLLI